MNSEYCCIDCKNVLEENLNSLNCKKCNHGYYIKDEYVDFSDNNIYDKEISKNTIKELLIEIEKNKYDDGIKKFVKKYPSLKSKLINTKYDQSMDSIFHGLGENNRCLILGSNVGNGVEILSHIFKTVYSVETNEDLLIFQKKRCLNEKINNVKFIRSSLEKLPFQENYFDLIIFGNTFFQFMESYFEQFNLKKMLEEIKKILKVGGCVSLNVENKSKISELIFDKKNGKTNVQLRYEDCLQIFNDLDFKTKSYWVLPSLDRPYFSTNIEDRIATKWYLKNFKFFIKGTKIKWKYQIFYKIFSLFDKRIISYLTKKFMPHFVFCCYKEKISTSLEDNIFRETGYSNCIFNSRRIKNVFILLDKKGRSKKIVHCKRYDHQFQKKISIVKRVFPKMSNPEESIWMEDWKRGETLNPFKKIEVISAVEWLLTFQKETMQEKLTNQEILTDTKKIKDNLIKFEELNKPIYHKWLENYEKFLMENNIKKTAVHGDFWYTNMLYDKKRKKVEVVDWENYKISENPFIDLITFLIRLMMLSSSDEVETFKSKLYTDKNFKRVFNKINHLVNEHFQCEVDLILLIKVAILKIVLKNIVFKNDAYITYNKLLHILKNNQNTILKGDS
jgi:ubiquinone/menaquinone biosynthesis C-methylase UbiE